ncbi:MAG: hypothetical protein ACI87E_004894, partial [Mariniblastus sp.]
FKRDDEDVASNEFRTKAFTPRNARGETLFFQFKNIAVLSAENKC